MNPTAIVGTSIMATACAAISAVTMAKLLQHLPLFRLPPAAVLPGAAALEERAGERKLSTTNLADKLPATELITVQPLPWWGSGLLSLFGLFFCYLFLRLAFPAMLGYELAPEEMKQTVFVRIVGAISTLAVPLVLSFFPLYAALRRGSLREPCWANSG